MTEKIVGTVLGYRYVPKVGKYIVKVSFVDEKAKELWMSERQLDSLLIALDKTPKGYSTGKVSVIAVFNDKGYYAYCKVEVAPWEPPPQYDLSCLEDKW